VSAAQQARRIFACASRGTVAIVRLELEVAAGGGSRWRAVGSCGRQQAGKSSKIFPRRLIQGGVGADKVADHIPRRQVECALGWRSHSQRDGTLRTETDPLGRRFLSRSYSHGLREHIYRDRFVSSLELSIAAKTIQVFQWCHPGSQLRLKQNTVFRFGRAQVRRRIPASGTESTMCGGRPEASSDRPIPPTREPSFALARNQIPHALCLYEWWRLAIEQRLVTAPKAEHRN
jgi:hypothetical protein